MPEGHPMHRARLDLRPRPCGRSRPPSGKRARTARRRSSSGGRSSAWYTDVRNRGLHARIGLTTAILGG
eukprot:12564559-Alexandrium_andersonii.AAC.1